MKQLLPFSHWKWLTTMVTLAVSLFAALSDSKAQLPDCTSGMVMYGAFSNVSTTQDSTEIRPINYTTGAIGGLMGVRRYYIRRRLSSGNPYIYGTAALGVDLITNRFYLMTQMSGAQPKDIITIDPQAPTATGTVIATTVGMDNYHFVKLAIAPNGFGYAIGVHRDSTAPASTFNPLIRFSTCGGSPSAGCANASLITLGYLPPTGNTYKWKIYNGDIAFDNTGNLYFLSAAYENVGGMGKYTNARLYRVNAADIPGVAGVGTIPMSFVADYDIIDSTGVSGIALDAVGAMYFSVKRFTSNNDPGGAFNSELYYSGAPGLASIRSGFAPIPVNKSIGDLASCYFPTTILASHKLDMTGKHVSGITTLNWKVNSNIETTLFEVQRSKDGIEFTTVGKVYPTNTDQADASYAFVDTENGSGQSYYYRIRQHMKSGLRVYSNIVKISSNRVIGFIGKPNPNPFFGHLKFNIDLRSSSPVKIRLIDQSGRVVAERQFKGEYGSNDFTISGLSGLQSGVYMAEFSAGNETRREKLIKQ